MVASRDIKRAQERLLLRILSDNKNSEFGRKYSFEKIRTPAEYQAHVPVRAYEEFLPFIDDIAAGRKSVLTQDPVLRFEPTSGSTSALKLVPHTVSLKNDFRRGIDPWVFSMYLEEPRLFCGSVYWSLTPSVSENKYTDSVVPVGFNEDREYFGKIQQWVFDTIGVVPPEVRAIKDIEAFRYCTLLFLLARRDLRLISVWSPTYLSFLLRDLPRMLSFLVSDLRSGYVSHCDASTVYTPEKKTLCSRDRVCELEAILRGAVDPEKTIYEAVWPEFAMISCWTDASAGEQIADITRMFPAAKIHPKGLLATEMLASFPFLGKYSVLSVNSHFFEFEETGGSGKNIFLAHELQSGRQYKLIVTTSGGLYRYGIGDIVEVTGFWGRVPILRFVGRGDKMVDLVGEKLSEVFLEKVMTEILKMFELSPPFWMVAPRKLSFGCYGYVLFIESSTCDKGTLVRLGDALETKLQKNYHYKYAREIKQLAPLSVFLIESGNGKSTAELFLETAYQRLKQQFGAIKLARLHRYEHWDQVFPGTMLKIETVE